MKWVIDSEQVVHAAGCRSAVESLQTYASSTPVRRPDGRMILVEPSTCAQMAAHLARPDGAHNRFAGTPLVSPCRFCIPAPPDA